MAKPTKSQLAQFDKLKALDPEAQIRWSSTRATPNRLRGVFTDPVKGAPETVSLPSGTPVANCPDGARLPIVMGASTSASNRCTGAFRFWGPS